MPFELLFFDKVSEELVGERGATIEPSPQDMMLALGLGSIEDALCGSYDIDQPALLRLSPWFDSGQVEFDRYDCQLSFSAPLCNAPPLRQ